MEDRQGSWWQREWLGREIHSGDRAEGACSWGRRHSQRKTPRSKLQTPEKLQKTLKLVRVQLVGRASPRAVFVRVVSHFRRLAGMLAHPLLGLFREPKSSWGFLRVLAEAAHEFFDDVKGDRYDKNA